jgi:L-alanine-DL-glutamate epimerase-like enolase superfamily enzyme
VRDVVKKGVVIEKGNLMPPDGPGLGVELDWDAVEEMRVRA